MESRMHYDDAAWEKSEEISDAWAAHILKNPHWNEIGNFLLKHLETYACVDFQPLKDGAFNTTLRMRFPDTVDTVIRFPLPSAIMFPEEKVRNEVAIMRLIGYKTTIPVPFINHWGEKENSPSKLGPFIVMDYIEHDKTMFDVLKMPGRPPDERARLDPDISIATLETLYRELASVLLSLSKLSLNRIGSLDQIDDITWEVAHRPLSYSMNELVQLGTLPRSKLPLPATTFDTASSHFEALAELHISHLTEQRNDAIDSADDCRRKFVARFLFRKLTRYQREQWISFENGPFPIWCDDFRPANILVDKALKIAGIVDWEFTYIAPVEFTHAPPWWLLIEKPEYWYQGLDDWRTEYEKRLQTFLTAMVYCEEEEIRKGRLTENQRLSGPMRNSWDSGDFWIMYAARNNFAFDGIYWQKIDQRFFGPTTCLDHDVWKERLDLLEPEEKEYMERYVDLKLRGMDTRVLAWDPDEYTLEYMGKMDD